jgi:hypothetical protein
MLSEAKHLWWRRDAVQSQYSAMAPEVLPSSLRSSSGQAENEQAGNE